MARNDKNEKLFTSLGKNIEVGNFKKVKKLMIKFQNSEKDEYYYDHCIDIANSCVDYYDNKMFDMVIKYIDIQYIDTHYDDGNFLLHFINANRDAIMRSKQQMCKKISHILDSVTNINKINQFGNTILFQYFECFRGNKLVLSDKKINVIKKMLELGADILGNEYMNSPLIWSIVNDNYDLTKLLLENAVVDGVKGSMKINMTMFTYALDGENINYDIVELLLQYLDDIDGINRNGRNIRDIIELNRITDENVIELLKLHGAQLRL